MKKLDNDSLDKICGGETLSGAVITAITGIIKILYDSGVSAGSAIRRMVEGSICPLK